MKFKMCRALIQQFNPKDLIYRYPYEYTPSTRISVYPGTICNYKQGNDANVHQQGLVK